MTATQFIPTFMTSKTQSFVQYAARTVTDGVTSSSTALTSASAVFTSLDVGASVTGTGIPGGATIVSVTNGTTVVLSASTTATGTGVTVTITRTTANAVSGLSTALTSAFAATAGTIQVSADGQVTGNALVVANDSVVLSVLPANWIGFNNSQWAQYTPVQMNGSPGSVFAQYFLT